MERHLTQERVRAALHYDAHSGTLTWIANTGDRPMIGKVAGSLGNHGYLRVSFDGYRYLVHRIIWFWMTGTWPKEVDHLNGIRTDNRWLNLRAATVTLNRENQHRAHRDSKTGFLGVRIMGSGFQARIQVSKKTVHLGTFDTPEQAHSEYLMAKRALHAGNTL